MQKVTNNVYVETGFAGSNNTFVTTSEGIVMIDTPQSAGEAVKWRDEIAKHGKVKYVINTEPHPDHVSGNWFFEGTVVAHEGVREAILALSVDQTRKQMKEMAPKAPPLPDDFCYKAPSITFSQRLTLHVGKHTFQLINLPGHTPYQTAVYIPEEKVVCTSDNITNGVSPFLFQALPYEWLESLKRYQELDAKIVVPGHGEVCDLSVVPQVSKIIQSWIDVTKEALKKGMSLEQTQKDTVLLKKHGIDLGKDPMMQRMVGINLTRLFEVLK
jgi:cyclase